MLKDKEKEIERYKAMHAYVVELVRATVAFEHAAVKPLFILNGGALVVVFALLGAIWNDRGQFAEKRWLVAALVCWGRGALQERVTGRCFYSVGGGANQVSNGSPLSISECKGLLSVCSTLETTLYLGLAPRIT